MDSQASPITMRSSLERKTWATTKPARPTISMGVAIQALMKTVLAETQPGSKTEPANFTTTTPSSILIDRLQVF
jgi:hypothetical protein